MQEPSRTHDALVRLISDLVLTELVLLLARLARPFFPFGSQIADGKTNFSPFVFVMVALTWGTTFVLLAVYEPREQRAIEEAQSIFVATTLATLILASFLYFTFRNISRLLILSFYLFDLVALIGFRLALRSSLKWAGKSPYAKRRVLILGAGEGGRDISHMVESYRWAGLELVGFLDDTLPPRSTVDGLPVLGRIDQVAQAVISKGVDEVVVALPLKNYDRFVALFDVLQTLPARVRIVPDHVKTTLLRTRVEELAGVPMITLQKPTLAPFERYIKRVFDLVVGSLSLLASLPLAAFIAIAIRLDTTGPAIFRQQRVGEDGRLFWMYKFRSMVQGAEKQQADLLRYSEEGYLLDKHRDDPRVTRVGRWIRRTSLDELPQLINVIKGNMSLVGPRPEIPFLVETYEPWQWQRLSVPQGITGWWQINGRSDKPMLLHTEDDLYYIQNYSLLLDIQILWRTVAAVLKRQGAF